MQAGQGLQLGGMQAAGVGLQLGGEADKLLTSHVTYKVMCLGGQQRQQSTGLPSYPAGGLQLGAQNTGGLQLGAAATGELFLYMHIPQIMKNGQG